MHSSMLLEGLKQKRLSYTPFNTLHILGWYENERQQEMWNSHFWSEMHCLMRLLEIPSQHGVEEDKCLMFSLNSWIDRSSPVFSERLQVRSCIEWSSENQSYDWRLKTSVPTRWGGRVSGFFFTESVFRVRVNG